MVEQTDGYAELDFIRMDGDDKFVGASDESVSGVPPLHVSPFNKSHGFDISGIWTPLVSLHPGFSVTH